ncbi:unnamed protein product [Phytophthora lilii]|uniref:Unnamed protein product n=1 Tax=Phytophthora lilii TaxID=2077276 RepID=A0A9W6XL06_9STRA|nr:unnamed protein product [Phytophthora lilii]
MPASSPSDAAFTAALIASIDAAFSRRHVRSTTDTSGVGTRNAMPVSLPFSTGSTLPTAFAAPVDDGMMFWPQPRPPRQSLPPFAGPSTGSCVAVVACTVVIRPSTMPNLSLITLASGARQFVVHDAFDTTGAEPSYSLWFTPITYMGVASLGGAEITTFLQPPSMWALAFSVVVNTPVDSHTYVAPALPHGISAGLRASNTWMTWPFTTRLPSLVSTVPSNLPCVESYLNRYAMYSRSMNGSLMATTFVLGFSMAARHTRRPMRPKPLMPMFTSDMVRWGGGRSGCAWKSANWIVGLEGALDAMLKLLVYVKSRGQKTAARKKSRRSADRKIPLSVDEGGKRCEKWKKILIIANRGSLLQNGVLGDQAHLVAWSSGCI